MKSKRTLLTLALVLALIAGCQSRGFEELGQRQSALSSLEYWIASSSEKVPRGAIPTWLTTTNRKVWDGTTVKIFGARNEVLGFQVFLRSTQSIAAMDMEVSALTNGIHTIANEPGATDPATSKGRRIQLFEQRYLYIERASGGPWGSIFWSQAAAPSGFAGNHVPDPLVPFEVNVANTGHPFSLSANTLQGLWVDVYVPKTAAPGTYTGTITIKANGQVQHVLPLELQVHCFTLPDKPTAKTMLYVDMPEVFWRHSTMQGTPTGQLIAKRYYQMLHRHKITPIESTDDASQASHLLPLLNGSLFSAGEEYEGPGENTGTGLVSIGTYGSWWWSGYDHATIQQKADAWANWLQQNAPTADKFLYVLDEPVNTPQNNSQLMDFALALRDHGGPGAGLPRMLTAGFRGSLAAGYDLWVEGAKLYDADRVKQACKLQQKYWIYNGYRPATGTFVLDDVGVSPRVNGWVQYKHGIPRWFYWQGNYWSDWQGGRGRLDPFAVAENFRNAWGEWGVGDGTLFYPGQQPAQFDANNLHFQGAISSIRLKNWRRGIQDYEYLALAKNVDPGLVSSLLAARVPTAISHADPNQQVSWDIRGDAWETARKQLADAIEASCQGGGSGPGTPAPAPSNTEPPVCTPAFVTAANGNWSSPSTWKGGQVPGPGDVVIVLHDLTVDADTTVGTTPADSSHEDILVLGPTGSLTVAAHVRLTVKGNLFLNDATLTLGEGATYEFDVPAGKVYQLKIGYADEQNSKLRILGTSAHRATVVSKAGGGVGQLTGGQAQTGGQDGGWRNGGQINAQYANFIRIGDATHFAHKRWPSAGSSSEYIFHHCIMDTTGDWTTTGFDGAHANIEFKNTTFRNSLSSRSLHIAHWGAAPAGSRVVQGCVFDKSVHFFTGGHYQIKDNYFAQAFIMSPGVPAAFSGNLIRKTDSLPVGIHAAGLQIKDNYFLSDHSMPYTQFVTPLGGGSTATPTRFQANIFEYTGSDSQGTAIAFNNYPSSPGQVEVLENIVLPNAAGTSPGTLMMLQGSAHLTLHVRRNTWILGNGFGVFVGLGYFGHQGMIASFRNNLAWDTQLRPLNFMIYNIGSIWTATDLVSADKLNYNNSFHALTGSNGNGYHLLNFSTGTPGENDLHVDPSFVDPARNLSNWAASLGSPGNTPAERRDHALSQLALMNDPGANDNYAISALLAYVRAGFAPTNQALKAAGDPADGSPDIGAVDVVSAP